MTEHDKRRRVQERTERRHYHDEQIPVRPWSFADRVWDVVLKLLVPLALAMVANEVRTTITIATHELRLKAIEESRFTDADSQRLRDEILEKSPPQWFRDDVREIKSSVQELVKRVSDLERNK